MSNLIRILKKIVLFIDVLDNDLHFLTRRREQG